MNNCREKAVAMVFIPENTQTFRFRRSVLFMPASNARAIKKAGTLACDSVIFDLEDAVSDESRPDALSNLLTMVKGTGPQGRERVIRTCQPGSANFGEDLTVAIECGVDAILLPKVEDAAMIGESTEWLKTAGSTARLWAMVETPMALLNLADIGRSCGASVGGRLDCLVVGPNDLAKTTGVSLAGGRSAMLPWLMQTVAVARAFGIGVLDGVYNNFRDSEGLAAECAQGAKMGFDGKTLIHPSQIEIANSAFGPSQEEISRARMIVEAFARPEHASSGAIQIEGEMVERLHLDMAQRLLKITGN